MMQDYFVEMMIVSAFREIIRELDVKDAYKNDREIVAALIIALTCKDNIDLIMEKWRKILDDKTGS